MESVFINEQVRDLVNGPSDNNTQIEGQVLDMWDRLYESWLARVGVFRTAIGALE